ncbi:hypothetical protein PS645_02735 [Pseudomonas fluorescens]|uniref:Uncharacterized protein n=1 Tax=Pseudomonas fluorescens TaxID=294 RepID=A0A5E6TA90_PSEFL|nr:hypothetical protein [Pseudomonas fluorescens]VVM90156.1 hypothetical protein PS645_02735 [Pseudomonas fluorescens]
MSDDSMFQGGTPNTNPDDPLTESGIDHDAPPGMDPSHDPAVTERPDDWKDPAAGEDMPPADEPSPLSDDRR